jgi:hypothetical protein
MTVREVRTMELEGIVHDGVIVPDSTEVLPEGTRVRITPVGTPAPSFTPEELADLRGKLEAWEEDWNAPGMEAYDDYEARRCSSGPVSPQ